VIRERDAAAAEPLVRGQRVAARQLAAPEVAFLVREQEQDVVRATRGRRRSGRRRAALRPSARADALRPRAVSRAQAERDGRNARRLLEEITPRIEGPGA
jgi:hypothetical protein